MELKDKLKDAEFNKLSLEYAYDNVCDKRYSYLNT